MTHFNTEGKEQRGWALSPVEPNTPAPVVPCRAYRRSRHDCRQ
jgi:hypothetical protein